MPYALQLYFDPVTDQIVRDVWRHIAQTGITQHRPGSTDRPHITLAVYAGLDAVRAEETLLTFVRSHVQFPLTFPSLGSFVSPSVVAFLAPVVTTDLLHFHHEAHETFGDIGTDPQELYLPGRWVPHCTIAVHVEARALPRVMEVSQELRLPLTGTVSEMGLVEVSPTRPLFSFELGAQR